MLLAIDPGETVGWAIFDGLRKVDGGQTDWGDFPDELAEGLDAIPGSMRGAHGRFSRVTEIVIEDFVIYPPDVGDGPPPPWDQVITARVIGAIQWIADMGGVPVYYQGAAIKSDALRSSAAEDFARPLYENRHENDATMHGAYFRARTLAQQKTPEARKWGEK